MDKLAEAKTHKKEFLGEQTSQLIPWSKWMTIIKPFYYKGERSNKLYDLELLLRIYVLQMVCNVAEKERYPAAHQVKKGNQWYFGYKGHVTSDKNTGLVKKIETTAANVHDVTQMAGLVDGIEGERYGNSGCLDAEKREEAILTNDQGKESQYIACVRRHH